MSLTTQETYMINPTQFANNARDFARRSVQYVYDNPGDVILFAVGIMLLDIDTTLEQIEEHEEIQTAFDLYQYHNGA